MADITGNTFNESKQRRKVLFQRGKDVLDSELNELQDILRVEARRKFADLFGSGYVAEGEFYPDADGVTNNTVFVRKGAGDIGRFYIDGYRVFIDADVAISGANYLADNPPLAPETHYIYVKLTEDEIDAVEDPTIKNNTLGSETTRRVQPKLEFFVDYSVPADTVADLHEGGAKYRLLGTINRAASATINASDIVDSRTQVALGGIREELRAFITGGGLIQWDLSVESLQWPSQIKIRVPGKSYSYTIAADTQTVLDNQVGYVVFNGSGGALTLVIANNSAVPEGELVFPLFIREGNDIHFRYGALELKGDAGSTTSGRISDITQDLMTFMGALSETDSDPDYSSAQVVAQGSSLKSAIGALDGAVYSLLNVNPDEEHLTANGVASIFNCASISWDADTTIVDILVYVDGRKQPFSKDGLFTSPTTVRKNSTTQIEFSTPPTDGSIVSVYLVRPGAIINGGGITWSTPVNASIVPDTGNAYDLGSNALKMRNGYFASDVTVLGGFKFPKYLNLTPQANDTAVPNNSLWVDSSDLYKVKLKNALGVSYSLNEITPDTFMVKAMQSSHGSTIPQGVPVSKKTDGTIVPTDSDTVTTKRFIGVTAEAIAPAAVGQVHLVGPNVVGALSGYPLFQPGDRVYMSETSGQYARDISEFTGGDDDIVQIGIADCTGGTASSIADDIVVVYRPVSLA